MKKSEHIALCGMPGSGKSTIGRELSKTLHIPFVDLDEIIELGENQSIAQIFEHHGESIFRKLEKRYLIEALQKNALVISLGGGALTNQEVMDLVLKKATLIYLKTDLKTLESRLEKERLKRPLLVNKDWKSTLRKLEEERTPLYEKAHWTIDGSNTFAEIVKEITQRID